jgi:hypothetical protein
MEALVKLQVHCRVQGPIRSLLDWSEKPSSSLSNLEQCIIINNAEEWDAHPFLRNLPCPRMRQLYFKGLVVQLEPA